MRRTTLLALVLFTCSFCYAQVDKTIFAYGGQVNQQFIKHTAKLTGKQNPKICFLPTANADNPYYINMWYELCADLKVEPSVMRVWINSTRQNQSWEEILTSVDAIIVGGGNTLNMLAIWKAQGINEALKKAYEQGIVIAGGSAGSLCWFTGGTTDSRPKELSIVEGLGFLNYSHCPHYSSEASRKPLYYQNILENKLDNGYACDDRSGIVFINEKAIKSVSTDAQSFSYYVYKKDGEVVEEKLEAEIIE